MDEFLPGILSFPPHPPPEKPLSDTEYDRRITDLLNLLNITPASQFTQSVSGSDNILTILDPSINSLPYLYALLAQLGSGKKQANAVPGTPLWNAAEQFVRSYDIVQIRYAGGAWKQLMDWLLSIASNAVDPVITSRALQLVQLAMLRLDPGTSTFTSTHLELVKISLRKRVYDGCLLVLENDIFHFPSSSDTNKYLPLLCAKHLSSSTFITTLSGFSIKLKYRDHLQYFLFGAMVYIAQQRWSRALALLESVLVSPVGGNTVSLIQAEAYKKWLLVHILCNGKPGYLPKNVSQHVSKYLTSLAKPYTVLADAFKEESPTKLRAEFTLAAERSVWQRDGNLGLVRLVVAAHRRAQVLNFSTVYSSISLKGLSELMSDATSSAQAESPAAIEADLRQLIASRNIQASISKGKAGDDIIKFSGSTWHEPLSEAQEAIELQGSVARIKVLGIHVKDAQSRLELTKEYIEATKKRRKPMKEGSEHIPGVGDIQNFSGMDEDMLAEF